MGGWWNEIFIITIFLSYSPVLYFWIIWIYIINFGLKDLFALHKLENILTHAGQIKILPRVNIFHKTWN